MDGMVTRAAARLPLRGRVALLGEYAGLGGDVADPYGCGPDEYRTCAQHIHTLVELALERVEREG
jgi:protein-tyrosine phosphatase/ribose 5-phosphate isomerase B